MPKPSIMDVGLVFLRSAVDWITEISREYYIVSTVFIQR